MQRLTLFAIAIDDVRDIFGAKADLADRLRQLAAQHFAPPAPKKRSFWRPLLTRDTELKIDPSLPNSTDVDALLSGGYVPPERMPQCWAILSAWLEHLAAGCASAPWDEEHFEQVEWSLATAGLNADYALRHLAERPLGIPLKAQPGQQVGYAKHIHVTETLAALDEVSPAAGQDAARLVAALRPALATAAASPGLDVVVISHPAPLDPSLC